MNGTCTPATINVFLAYVVALVVVGVYLFISAVVTRGQFLDIIMGADGRPSASKFQFFLWTGVVFFTYAQSTAPGSGAGTSTRSIVYRGTS